MPEERNENLRFPKNERTSRSKSVAMSKSEESGLYGGIPERVLLHKPSLILHSFQSVVMRTRQYCGTIRVRKTTTIDLCGHENQDESEVVVT